MPQAPARRATSESSDVAKLVRLHHRRRGWAWVAIGSVIGLVVYVGIDVNLFENLTGTAETLSVIPVFVLLALVLAGLVVVIVDTSRIHRADAAVRVSAKGSVSHYPLYAHAHRYPPRHRGSWVFAIVMLVAMTGITVFILPAEVNSWAYAVGAENQDTFNPVSYGQACSQRAPGRLPHGDRRLPFQKRRGRHLGQPGATRPAVQCPRPALGLGQRADSHQWRRLGDPDIVAGLFFDGVTLLLLYALVVIVRDTASRRSQRMSVPAGADPGGVRRTHHPARGHHGSGVRRPARRGRGRR